MMRGLKRGTKQRLTEKQVREIAAGDPSSTVTIETRIEQAPDGEWMAVNHRSPSPPVPASDEAKIKEIANKWYEHHIGDHSPRLQHQVLPGAVAEAFAEGRRLEREACEIATDKERATAHALAGLRMDGWCSWLGADVHGEQCDRIYHALAQSRAFGIAEGVRRERESRCPNCDHADRHNGSGCVRRIELTELRQQWCHCGWQPERIARELARRSAGGGGK